MNIIVINGQPKKEGLSKFLSETYAKKKKEEGHEVKIINIFNLNFKPFVKDVYNSKLESSLVKSQEAISWADHLVFFYPIWWVEMPAMLKSFLERVLIPNFAFKYINGKKIKLLKGKTAEVYATAGGSKRYNSTIGKIDQYRTIGKILFFCGINLKKVKVFHSIRPNMSEKIIEKLKRSVC